MIKQKAEMIAMLKRGICPKDIKALLPGTNSFQVSRQRRLLGIKPFKSGRKPFSKNANYVDLRDRIRSMKLSGMTYAQIGKKLGYTKQRMQQWLRIPRPPNKNRCEQCKSKSKKLHCHHLSYEDDSKYEVLCAACHKRRHRGRTGRREKFLKLHPIVISMRKSGMKYREIAEEMKVAMSVVKHHLKSSSQL